MKLLDRGCPLSLVLVLQNWFSKSFSVIKWNNILSEPFQVKAGIRQGGVLSPILFSVYVDNVLLKLSNYGCFMHGLNFGSFMFADDLVLLAPSIVELQCMINICCNELRSIDLVLNEKKSYFLVLEFERDDTVNAVHWSL